jgi:hypothetical protein
VRAVLPAIHVPTLVLQRLDDRITPPCHGRYLASHIAGARYFEQPGDHSLRFAQSGDSDALCAEIASFLASTTPGGDSDRVLATIMHAQPADLGDIGDRDDRVTGTADIGTGPLVRDHRGRLIKATSDGILATFDTPGRAIRCAAAMLDSAAAHGIRLRAGIHTGEVDRVGDGITGISVQITDRVARLARPAEILVSRTVKDLVTGSGICFTERGRHELNAADGPWPLFAVAGVATADVPGG